MSGSADSVKVKPVQVRSDSRTADGQSFSMQNPRKFVDAPVYVWPPLYFDLGKGKLSALITVTAAAGFVVAIPAGIHIPVGTLVATSTGTALASMGASAFNQIIERTNDKTMARTARRPLPSGRISVVHATSVACLSSAAGVGVLLAFTNPLASSLAAANVVLYALCYTPLKQYSIWNTWVGAVVGAIPPMIGWAAATGGLDAGAWIMGGILFSWQMPHFLALAYMMRNDYRTGGYKMMPGEAGSPGLSRATKAVMRHCLYLQGLSVGSVWLGLVTTPFALEATVLNLAFFFLSLKFHTAGQDGGAGGAGRTNTAARRLFLSSLAYLPILLALMAIHRAPPVPPPEDAIAAAAATACPYLEATRVVAAADAAAGAPGAVVAAAAVPAEKPVSASDPLGLAPPAPARRVHG